MTSYYEGSGGSWWAHVGTNATEVITYPDAATVGGSTLVDTESATFGARLVVIYKIIVLVGQVGDTLGMFVGGTSLSGFTALPIGTTGQEYNFPGGLRIEAENANISISTQDDSTVVVFYRKVS